MDLLPCYLLGAWAAKGQRWKAVSSPAEDIKPCLAERSRSWWLPPSGSSFPFPLPLFCPASRYIKALDIAALLPAPPNCCSSASGFSSVSSAP